jgi:transketolase
MSDPDRDYFLLSKGHDVPAVYGTLAELGYFPRERLKNHLSPTDSLYWHPNRKIPGVEFHSGSLGHLLSVAIGVAMDIKMRGGQNRVFVVLGDGECNEGSIWEGLLVAKAYGLDNLVAIVDRNELQANVRTEELIPLEPLHSKFMAFGWEVRECDGHDFTSLEKAFDNLPASGGAAEGGWDKAGRPTMVIARTVRGKGLPSLERRADRWFVSFKPEDRSPAQGAARRRRRRAHLRDVDGALMNASNETLSYEAVLRELAQEDERVVVMTAENRAAIRNLPRCWGQRFIDVGISEQTMIGVAAGLSLRGRRPVCHALATFLTLRAYEFIATDLGIPNLPAVLVGGVPGFLSDANGPTHQAIDDVALMRTIPNVRVVCPADEHELADALPELIAQGSPCYVRHIAMQPAFAHKQRSRARQGRGPEGGRRDRHLVVRPGLAGVLRGREPARAARAGRCASSTCRRSSRSTRRRSSRRSPAARPRSPSKTTCSPAVCSRSWPSCARGAARARTARPLRARGALVRADAAQERARARGLLWREAG